MRARVSRSQRLEGFERRFLGVLERTGIRIGPEKEMTDPRIHQMIESALGYSRGL
jgi:molecular chaperone GrpE (heat shock protein)